MQAWRIAKRQYATDRAGTGGLYAEGRWHERGTPVIYCGASVEICALESLAHTGPVLPDDLVLVEFVLPDEDKLYRNISAADLPPGWAGCPPLRQTKAAGTRFLRDNEALALFVPSAIVVEARNLLINPHHPRFADVSIEVLRDFSFDPRLRP
jgi:RES domain-containing protein